MDEITIHLFLLNQINIYCKVCFHIYVESYQQFIGREIKIHFNYSLLSANVKLEQHDILHQSAVRSKMQLLRNRFVGIYS